MNSLAIVTANLLCLALLLHFFDFSYRSYRVDLLRFKLFRARDRLFEAAAQGVLAFDHSAYGMTRQMLNGMIRFAHELSLWRALVMWVSRGAWDPQKESDAFWRRYGDAVDSLSGHGQMAVRAALAQAHLACLSHMLHTSLLTVPFALIGKTLLRLYSEMRSLRTSTETTRAQPLRRAFDREAYLVGNPFEP